MSDIINDDEDDQLEIETRTTTTSARETGSPSRTISTVSTTRRLRESGLAYVRGASLWDMAILLAWVIVIVLLVVVIVESIFSAIEPETRLLGLWIIFIVLLVLTCVFTTIITYTRACSCRCRRPSCCIRASSSSSPDPEHARRQDLDEQADDDESRQDGESRQYTQNTRPEQRRQTSKPRCGYGCCSCLKKTKTRYSTVDGEDIDDNDNDANARNDLDLEQQEQEQGTRGRPIADRTTERVNVLKTRQRQQRQKQVLVHGEAKEEESREEGGGGAEEKVEAETIRDDESDYRIYAAEPPSSTLSNTDIGSTRKPNAAINRTRSSPVETYKAKKLGDAKVSKKQEKIKVRHFISMKQTGKVAPATQSLSRVTLDDGPNTNTRTAPINDVATTPKNKLMKTTPDTVTKSFSEDATHSSDTSSSGPIDHFQEKLQIPSSKSKILVNSPTDKPSAPTIVKPLAGGRKLNTSNSSTTKSKAVV